jgi:hypothetical protein
MGRKKEKAKSKAKSKAKASEFFRKRAKSEARFNIYYDKLQGAVRKGEVSREDPFPDLLTVEESEEYDDDSDD